MPLRRTGIISESHAQRQPLIDDHKWQTMAAEIDPAAHLEPDAFVPEATSVYACGAYYSRGSGRAAPWSRYLRKSKLSEPDPVERESSGWPRATSAGS